MYLLLEDGGHFLLQDGTRLALEDGPVASLLLEDTGHLLIEDNGRLLLEGITEPPVPPVETQKSSGSGYKGRYRQAWPDEPIQKEKTVEVKLYKDFKVIKAHVWDKSASTSKVIADGFRPLRVFAAQAKGKSKYYSKSLIKATAQTFASARLKSSQTQIAQASAIRSASVNLYNNSAQVAFGTAINLNSTISCSQYNSVVFADRHAIAKGRAVKCKHFATAQADQIIDFTPEQMEMLMMVVAKEFLN